MSTIVAQVYGIEWYKSEAERLEAELAETKDQLRLARHEIALRGHTINKLSNRIGKQRRAHRQFRDKQFHGNDVQRVVNIIARKINENLQVTLQEGLDSA